VEVVNSLLRDERLRWRHSSLRWGIVLLSVALGFGLIEWAGWTEITPGLIAVLVGCDRLRQSGLLCDIREGDQVRMTCLTGDTTCPGQTPPLLRDQEGKPDRNASGPRTAYR